MSHPQPAPLPTSRCFGLPTTDRTHHRSSNRQRRCDPIHASRRVSGALAPGRPELADFSRNARYSRAWCAPARAHFRTSTSISTAHRSPPSRSRRQRDLPRRSHARRQRRAAQGSERRTGPHAVRSHTVDTRDRVVGEPSRPRRARSASTPLGGFMSKRRSFEEILDSEFRWPTQCDKAFVASANSSEKRQHRRERPPQTRADDRRLQEGWRPDGRGSGP